MLRVCVVFMCVLWFVYGMCGVVKCVVFVFGCVLFGHFAVVVCLCVVCVVFCCVWM